MGLHSKKRSLPEEVVPMILSDLEKIHEASLVLLERVGVAFHSPMALEIFTKHGFRTEEKVVHFSAKQVEKAIGSAPAR